MPPLRWLAQKIAGDDFEVISIVQPNMNHELFEPKPSDLKILENSKVFFTYNMLGFEETISNSLSDKNKIVNVLDGVDKIYLSKEIMIMTTNMSMDMNTVKRKNTNIITSMKDTMGLIRMFGSRLT